MPDRLEDGSGDIIACACAWDISHHDFLVHPQPCFIYLG
jgi:hypothetical protein